MKLTSYRKTLFVLLFIFTLPLGYAANSQQATALESWPRTLQVNGRVLTFYQPQIENLKNNQLTFQMAISAKPQDSKKEHYGSLTAQCRLDIDKSKDLATCNALTIQRLSFPNVTKTNQQWVSRVKQDITKKSFTMPFSSISMGLKMNQLTSSRDKAAFQFTPPTIYVAFKPTALISIDGKPQLRPLKDTSLMHVINTPFVILLDAQSGWYYLQAGQQWMQAKAIQGPWQKTTSLPASIKKIEKKQTTQSQATSAKPIEDVIVSIQPASLIQINGKAEFSPIQGTSLLYVSNTKDQVFLKIKTQEYYALVSGRWYKSNSLSHQGKWTYVSPQDIPSTFSHIPTNSEKSAVLSSVAGTDEAKEAVIKNQIPQTAVVKRSQAKLSVKYDGKPKFVRIPNTKVYYAANTDKAVFRLGQRYYANYQAVWFTASNAQGPWVVATQIPDAIYKIPPSSPHYNVTYSYVYGATPEVVYVGYTSGYTGSYVYQGTVIYGTGYYYPGWTGTVYYGYPVTWGFGFYYQPYYGGWYPVAPYAGPMWFGAGFAAGVATASIWNHGWFGHNHYYGYRGGHNNININVNHNTNIYNSWHKNTVIHNTNIHNNLFENKKSVHNTFSQKNVTRKTKVKRHNNVYSGRDGHVYRHHNNQWQQSTSKGWENRHNFHQEEHLNRQREFRSRPNRQFEHRGRFR